MLSHFLRLIFRRRPTPIPERVLEDRMLRSVEWTLTLMHQTETKAIAVLGFYLALVGGLLGTGSGPRSWTAILLAFLGLVIVYLMYYFRKWKQHYLEHIQALMEQLRFAEATLPTSLRWTGDQKDPVTCRCCPSLDGILVAIPAVTVIVLVCISFCTAPDPCTWYYPMLCELP